MIDTTLDEPNRADVDQPPKAIAADAAYGNQQQLNKDAADNHIPAPNLCVRIGTLPTSAYASARTSTTPSASAATELVNGHPSPACGWDYRIRRPAGSRRAIALATFRSPGIGGPATASSPQRRCVGTDSAYAIRRLCTRRPPPRLRRQARLWTNGRTPASTAECCTGRAPLRDAGSHPQGPRPGLCCSPQSLAGDRSRSLGLPPSRSRREPR